MQINIENGEAKKLNNCIFQLKFHKARSGKTILFGQVLKDASPEMTNEVSVLIDNKVIARTSHHKLLKLNNQRISGQLIYDMELENLFD